MLGEIENLTVYSPFDGSEIGQVPAHTVDQVNSAISTALQFHLNGAPEAWERARILDMAADCFMDSSIREEFATMIAREAAKPIKTARIEVARASETFRFAATAARTLAGETIPLDASTAAANSGKLGFVMRVPIGVVVAITPFNFPLNLVAHKVAPAIAAGCPVVLKPSSATPLTALALYELLVNRCGLPPEWISVVTCSSEIANHLVTHPDVSLITFTGSPEVGWSIRAKAPRKKVCLELGNNAPVIIEPDASIRTAAAKISVAGFAFAGQTCISVQRVYLHEAIAQAFLDSLIPRVEELNIGDPLDETTDVSVLITPDETERVMRAIEAAVESGARIACGGRVEKNGVIKPTVLTDVQPKMEVCKDEIFGPVVSIATYENFDEAVALANNTRYGLQASVFTSDLSRALSAIRKLQFGTVLVNEVPSWRADNMPYGGVRDSGNTKEGPSYAVAAMTEERLVVLEATGDGRL